MIGESSVYYFTGFYNMNKIGFTKSKYDAAVFYRHNVKGFAIIALAKDGLTIAAINDDIIHEIKADFMKIFKMKDLGELHWLLNLKIEWDRISKSISFSQEAYIDKMLKWFNIKDSKTHTVAQKTVSMSPDLNIIAL